jgi:hypothetical protein
MNLEMLRELQQRGRFFWEMFPGAKASDEWQRHRDQMERERQHRARSLPSDTTDQTNQSSASE